MTDPQSAPESFSFQVGEDDVGQRFDVFLSQQLPGYSRVFLRRLINDTHAKVGDKRVKAAYRLKLHDAITVELVSPPQEGPEPEEIPLDILFEDEHLAVINKPPAMVVHPAKGHWQGTLASALSYHFQNLSTVGGPNRPGIVHRLDRDTSGVIAVAKSDVAHHHLAKQFELRTVEKEYLGIVLGVPDRDRGEIREPIGIHPYQREKMAIRRDHPDAREAHTFYETEQRYPGFATVRLMPKSGRTHQLRVHLAHIGHPILCDRLYGGRAQITTADLTKNQDQGAASETTPLLSRQALHARRLKLAHPITEQAIDIEAPIPPDMQSVIDVLQNLAGN